jgi:hypothetical protein
MNYYDVPGVWTESCTIKDYSAASATDSSHTVTYNSLFAVALDKAAMTFGSLTIGNTQAATNNPLSLLNQGNQQVNNVSLKAYDLVSGAKSIPAQQFNVTSVEIPATDSFWMVNQTYVQFPTLTVPIGAGTNKNFNFYIKVPNPLAVGTYTSYNNPWVVYTSN